MQKIEMKTNENTAMPIYRQVANTLIEKICSGEFPDGMRFPPETELATMLGIHRITLRKSLSILVSLNLIVQMPHRGTFVSKRPQQKIRIGILTRVEAQSEDPYLNKLFMELAILLARHDQFEYTFINLCHQDEDITKCGCDALLIPYQSDIIYPLLSKKKYASLPMVFINLFQTKPEGRRFSVSQEPDSILRGVEYLLKVKHKKIAFFSSRNHVPIVDSRTNSVLQQHFPEIKVYYADDSWNDKTISELTLNLCRSKDRPSAILLPFNRFVPGTLLGIAEAGLKIPQDISLLAFDPPYVFRNLSTIEQPLTEMLQKALDILYEACTGKTFRNHGFLFKVKIIDRGSVR